MRFLVPSLRAFILGYLKYPEAWLHRYALEEFRFQLIVHKKGQKSFASPPRDGISGSFLLSILKTKYTEDKNFAAPTR
jgi:hypothetical protein